MSPKQLAAALLALSGLGAAAAGCGGGTGTRASAKPAAAATVAQTGRGQWETLAKHESKRDRDNDNDNATASYYDEDDNPVLDYGRPATARELRQMKSVLRRYFRAAVAKDGSAACALLNSVIAESLGEEPDNPHPSPHSDCATFATMTFRLNHQRLAAEARTLEVRGARVEGDRAWAILGFGAGGRPGRTLMHREGRAWKVNQLLRIEMS